MTSHVILTIHAFVLATLVFGELPAQKVYPGYLPSKLTGNKPSSSLLGPNALRTLVIQLRSSSHVPQLILKRSPHFHQHYLSRPLSARPAQQAISPQFLLKGSSIFNTKRPLKQSIIATKLKITNPKLAPTGYAYEKPSLPEFSHVVNFHKKPIDSHPVRNKEQHFAPIHTIPAPNLFGAVSDAFHDNHIHIVDHSHDLHKHNQYQVTEDVTNDQTIQDPFSGKHTYFAPDPDPSLPAKKIRPATDAHSIPSIGKQLPEDVGKNLIVSKPMLQYVHPVAHPQLTDSYGLPLTNQPQLQQFLVQHASSNGMPTLSVYNPTYLVTQSNNLFNHHQEQQQLFRPDSNYMSPLRQNSVYSPQVASSGQSVQASLDPGNNINLDYQEEDDAPLFQALQLQGHPSPSETEHAAHQHIVNSHQQQEPEQLHFENSNGFVGSHFYGNTDEAQSYKHQVSFPQSADNTLPQTNFELQHEIKQNNHEQRPVAGQKDAFDSPNAAYAEHQRLLEEQFGSTPLRIFVPDDENEHRIQQRFDQYAYEDGVLDLKKEKENELFTAGLTSNEQQTK